ncbi:MAG: hypothetical protein J0G30_10570 [Actinomycetales bacterium]|nr:hypothetical protein [Actinomycetales bacterium]
MPDAPPIGLLLDVDGPVSSPVERRIVRDAIAEGLTALANAGCPLVFNTGRSDAFVREVLLPRLVAAGLRPDAPVHAVGEKGATWFSWIAVDDPGSGTDGGLGTGGGPRGEAGPVGIDDALRVPVDYVDAAHRILDDRFADWAFWDDTKRTMVSIEARTDVPNAEFRRIQPELDAALQAELDARDLGGSFELEPSIIACDVQHRGVGKDVGARRALALVVAGAHGAPLPRLWLTAGDSRSDYRMSDELHARGFEVVHVDARAADADWAPPEVAYRVIHRPDLEHDDAFAAVLPEFVERALG